MVKSEKPVYKLRQCLNVQCEVASPNRSHKQDCRADTAGQLTITLSFWLNYAPVCQARGLGGSVLEYVDFTCSWCVFFNGRGARQKLSPSGLVLLG